jgi:putative Holliday junction resolvase
MIYDNITQFKAELAEGQRLLGLDYGQKKIGLALSDTLRLIATPYSVIICKSYDKDIASISKIIHEFTIGGIVCGWPLSMNGEVGPPCLLVDKFIMKILKRHDLPVFYQDERFSTAAVTRTLRETNLSWKKKAAIDDQMAASYILQSALDRVNYRI